MNAAKRVQPQPSVRRSSGVRPATSVRQQAACVRTLLDEVERAIPADLEDPMTAQIAEELNRLGCLCVELAAELCAIVDQQAQAQAQVQARASRA